MQVNITFNTVYIYIYIQISKYRFMQQNDINMQICVRQIDR